MTTSCEDKALSEAVYELSTSGIEPSLRAHILIYC
jgi:hypothetical protein